MEQGMETAARQGEKRLRILVVDDDKNEREGIRFLIERASLPLTIAEAANGKQALERMQEQAFDILFTDIKMPYMDGLTLAQTVCTKYPAVKIIIFSAYGEFEYAQRAMEARAVNYLLKPVEVDRFYSVLRSVIDKSRQEEALLQISQKRQQADRELRWIQLLSGKTMDTAVLTSLLSSEGSEMTLMHLEVLSDYFAQQEQRLTACLQANAPCPFDYVNLYPNSSYLILHGVPERTALLRLGNALLDCAAQDRQALSILIAQPCCGMEALAVQAKEMRQMRDRTVIWGNTIQFLPELAQPGQQGFLQIEACKSAAMDAVETGDTVSILSNVDALLEVMSQNGALSTIYMHHIFSELLVRLDNGENMNLLQSWLQRLAACRTPQEILALFDSALQAKKANADALQDSSRAVQKVIAYIRNEYSTELSLEELAQRVGFSASYLSYIFKKETGENLIKYLTDYRMQRAKELLDGHEYKVAQVARQCGYDNPSYFNRLFKNTFGMTPTQYRERTYGTNT